MRIVIINGAALSGKNTFVRFCGENREFIVEDLSTVDMVKRELIKFGLWDGKAKGEKERRLMSDMKDMLTRYNNGPFLDIVGKIKRVEACYKFAETIMESNAGYWKTSATKIPEPVIFVHCREPEEIQKFKDHYGPDCITLLIDAEERQTEAYSNHADQEVGKYNYEHTVYNNGSLDMLRLAADLFMETLKKVNNNG